MKTNPVHPQFVFARVCLLVTWFALAASALMSLAVVAMASPQAAALIVGLVALVYLGAKTPKWYSGWKHGSAVWATAKDVAPLMHAEGLPLGSVDPPKVSEAWKEVFRAAWKDSERAVRLFSAASKKKRVPIAANNFTHAVAFAPAGKGKSTGLVIPYVLTCRDGMGILDIKGEIYKATHRFRRSLGRVVVLDPFNQTGARSDSWNALDMIDLEDPNSLDNVRALAAALVPRTGQEKEPFWDDACEMFIAAVTAFVCMFSGPDRNLQSVCQVLASPELLKKSIDAMRKSTAWDGLLARMGDQLMSFVDKTRDSVLATVARHLRFLSTPAVLANTTTSSFDARTLLDGKTSVFFVVPPDKLQSQSGLIRLWVTSLMQLITRTGLKNDRKFRLVLDEAASLGQLPALDAALVQLRGYGLSCLLMYQSVGQLKRVFGEGQDQTFMANMDARIFFGVNDYQTAEQVSNMLGTATISNTTSSGGTNRGTSVDPHGLESGSSGSNTGWSTQEGARKLLLPEEVMQLNEREAVVFLPNMPPLLANLSRSYEPEFKDRMKRGSGLLLAVREFFVAAMVVAFAGLLGYALSRDDFPEKAQQKGVRQTKARW